MKFITQLSESLRSHPIAWLLGALLVLALYHNWKNEADLTTVCDNVDDMMLGPPALESSLQDWQQRELDEIKRICGL